MVHFTGVKRSHEHRSILVYSEIDLKGKESTECRPHRTTAHLRFDNVRQCREHCS